MANMAARSLARVRPRRLAPISRSASTSSDLFSSVSAKPSDASSSTIAPLNKTNFRDLRLSLLDRTLDVARSARLLDLSPAEIAETKRQEREAASGAAAKQQGPRSIAGKKKTRNNSMRYLTPAQIKDMEREKRAREEKAAEVRVAQEAKQQAHPGIKALKMDQDVVTVELEVRAGNEAALKKEKELHQFVTDYLPALMWANPSVSFPVSFGRPATSLHLITDSGAKRSISLSVSAFSADDALRKIVRTENGASAASVASEVILDTPTPPNYGRPLSAHGQAQSTGPGA